jgi:hypothetical protein
LPVEDDVPTTPVPLVALPDTALVLANVVVTPSA